MSVKMPAEDAEVNKNCAAHKNVMWRRNLSHKPIGAAVATFALVTNCLPWIKDGHPS
jgi:hypothetical protein